MVSNMWYLGQLRKEYICQAWGLICSVPGMEMDTLSVDPWEAPLRVSLCSVHEHWGLPAGDFALLHLWFAFVYCTTRSI